jgi:competence protein ComEA
VHVVTPTPGSIQVYVTGETVESETVVDLPAFSRVQDAIEAAGGATDNADLSRVNLSQILNDGDYVYVPPLVGDAIQTPTPNHAPLVHINYATVDELDTLPGIGPSLAQAIIDYRTENGPFASLDDLDQVPGIGPATLEDLQELVVFD